MYAHISRKNLKSKIPNLQFLKLGGSLITDKAMPHTPRLDTIHRLAEEIVRARKDCPELHLVLGHGSGSFGHIPARKYGTRAGVHSPEQWTGFIEVWKEAQSLNRLVIDALSQAGLPVIALSPLASVTAQTGRVLNWDIYPVQAALHNGLLPVIYGDVIFDTTQGGTILSTEDLFSHLSTHLRPERILLAGIEAGVWADFPACTERISEITPANYAEISRKLEGATAIDVTGGMASKVELSLAWVRENPGMEVLIFSGDDPAALKKALCGATIGTRISG